MTCADYEPQIADWLDGRLDPATTASVEQHLAECPGCAAFAASLRVLDASLARRVQLRPLTPGFETRLRARLDSISSADAEARRAELKRALQADYEATLARMRRRVGSWSALLDVLGLGLLTAGTLTAAVSQVPKLMQVLPPDLQSQLGSPLTLGAAAGTVLVLAAAWFYGRRPARLHSVI